MRAIQHGSKAKRTVIVIAHRSLLKNYEFMISYWDKIQLTETLP